MSGRSLPALLRTNVLQRPETQSVDTSILRPVNFNQQGCRYVFERKGILDSNSHLQMKLRVKSRNGAPLADETTFEAYLPTSTGACSFIRRAYLTIGGRRVSNLDEVGHYTTWNRLHYSNEYKKGVIQPKQGGNDVFLGSTARAVGTGASQKLSRGFNTPYGVLGREGTEYGITESGANGGLQEVANLDQLTKSSQQIRGDANLCPTFMVGISQLIPFLRGVQLPLFSINQEVALNIEWSRDVDGLRFMNNDVASGALTTEMVEEDCLICADYLFYPDLMAGLQEEIMEKGGYDIPYDEILTQENQITLGADGERNNFDIQLAYGGKKVKSVLVQRQLVDGADEYINLIGQYNSLGYRLGKTTQLNIDAKNWYSMPLSNGSLQKSELDQVEDGLPVMCNDYRYCWKGNVEDDGTDSVFGITYRRLNSVGENSECGAHNWSGVKLSNAFGQGKRVSNLPMIHTETVDVNANDDGQQRRLRFFVKTQRVCNVSSGIVNIIE